MGVRVLSLAKGAHKYIFRYAAGCEDQVIDEILRLADDPDSGLDWLDAAALGFQVTHYAALGCPEFQVGQKTPPVIRAARQRRHGPPSHATDGTWTDCP